MAKNRPTDRRKGSAKVKSESLLVRLSVAEKEGFAKAADIAGIALSAWVRERLRWAAVKELQAADVAVPFLEHLARNHEETEDGDKGQHQG